MQWAHRAVRAAGSPRTVSASASPACRHLSSRHPHAALGAAALTTTATPTAFTRGGGGVGGLRATGLTWPARGLFTRPMHGGDGGGHAWSAFALTPPPRHTTPPSRRPPTTTTTTNTTTTIRSSSSSSTRSLCTDQGGGVDPREGESGAPNRDLDAEALDFEPVNNPDGTTHLLDTTTGIMYDMAEYVENDRVVRLLVQPPRPRDDDGFPFTIAAHPDDDIEDDADDDDEVGPSLVSGSGGRALEGTDASAGEGGETAAPREAYTDEDFAPWNLADDTVGLGDLASEFARPDFPRLTSIDDLWECPLVQTSRSDTDPRPPAAGPGEWNPHEVAMALLEEQADDIVVIELDAKSRNDADYMIIASGRSRRHVKAMGRRLIRETKQRQLAHRANRSNEKVGADAFEFWVVVAARPCIVHIFLPEAREYYDLESLWAPHAVGSGDDDDLF